ncbi:MAG: large repetitive protein [Actinomycetota bacterium]|nr:large repetitive protein [Actinomycetota bacterium]
MLRRWIASRKSLVMTATSGFVVAAVIAAVAIVSTGYTAQQLNLNDSSVWVANGSQASIGRANTTVRTLNSVVPSTGNDLDVLQGGSTVLLVDNANSKLEIVDPATSAVTQSVPLPPNKPKVFLSQNNVVILAEATGQAWITPIQDLAEYDSQSPATLSLGANAVASMDDTGTLFIYSPSQKAVYSIRPDVTNNILTTDPLVLAAKDTVSISSVADHWAVLDSTTDKVYVAEKVTDLAGTVAAVSPAIQQASSTGDRILVAGASGLASLSLDGSSLTTVVRGQSGEPAQPLVAAGCDFAAWSGGSAWRRCTSDGADGTTMSLAAVSPANRLEFRSNGSRVVLNDSLSGEAWAVQSSGQLINNWDALIAPKDQQQQDQQKTEDTPPQVEKKQLPPVAVDDQFGARPGRSTVLPVLLNDYDPNGDVLSITSVTPIDAKIGHVDLINDQQQLQLALASTAAGTINFKYTISDGRGGTATASVAVTVRMPAENSPPKQVRTSKTIVAQGGRVTTPVLGDWVDPDGDPMYVTAASTSAPDSVSFTPAGTIVYSDGGKSSGLKTVSVTVSDGKSETTGSLAITVRAVGKVPIIADPFIQIAIAGKSLSIAPLVHVRGGSGTLRLNSVPTKAGVTVTPSYEAGTFQFVSTQVGTHYLDYVVTDGSASVTGVVRVDVIAPPESNTKPITIPQTVFVKALSSSSVDVADSDIDPAGGVLLVTGVAGTPTDSGITTEILQQRSVRVTLAKPLDGPVTIEYTVSNGFADAKGSITVVEIPTPTQLQPPIANDDSVTVRAGAAIDIPVLANDQDPDGEPLTLVPALVKDLPAGAGLLFPSGDVLRYLAPSRPGNYSAVYEIAGPDGQTARAQVKIAVRQADVDTNNPPVPETLTARVLAGGTVNINVPLSGIDPDGDTVQLLGQETNPEKGSVTAVGPHSITYKAGDYSAGTDSFTYSVIDALGARATGIVRVGIAAPLGGAPNPIATLDDVRVRPGVTVSVQVLANDSDPNGSPLHVVSAVPNDKVTKVKVVGNIVDIRPPSTPAVYGVIYTIGNETGGTSSAFVRVTVDPKAPLSFPVANDTVLTLSDVLNRSTVDVNVLANVFFADGPSSDLGLSVYPGFGATAKVTPNKHIQVTVTAHSQIIPFKVTHPDDPNVFSYAFIWVPGTDDALPQLDRTAPALQVVSGAKLTIDLNKYVIAVNGKSVQLTDSSSVRATHANSSSLVVDDNTLQYTSATSYFGPASISFEVTDGTSPTDPAGHRAVLVLPITVLPKTNQPPVFTGALIDFEQGQQIDIDLAKLTNYPAQNDINQLVFTLLAPLPKGFTVSSIVGQHVTIAADDNAVTGTSSALSVGVRDDNSVGTAGRIQLEVVQSTRPLAQPSPDVATVKRGATTTVDVLANDNATNPFPGTPLRVIAIRGIGGASLPAGVVVTPSTDKSRLTVKVSAAASPGDTTFQYEVADATNDPDRYVFGSVTISVEDRPDPVTNVGVTDFSDRSLTVTWNNGAANNSPITGYTVIETDANTGAPVSSTDCSGALCSVSTPGNGPDNAVRIAVTATNAIGTSDAATISGPVWSDVIPAAPTDLASSPLDHGLTITWSKPPSGGGSAITKYVISVEGTSTIEVQEPAGDPAGTVYSRGITDSGIDNGSSVGYSVSARNGAFAALANWNSASGIGHPAGPPQIADSPNASADINDGTTATLSWGGAFTSNGRGISNYYAAVFSSGDSAPTCGVSGDLPGSPDVPGTSSTFQSLGTGTSTTFDGLTPNTTYSFVVYAFNGMGCTASAPVTATPRQRPGQVSSIQTDGPISNGTNLWDFRLTGFTIGSGSTNADTFEYKLSGGGVDQGVYGPFTAPTFLTTTNQSQYDQTISVSVKACQQYQDMAPLCSADWSTAFPLGVPVQGTVPSGLTFTHTDDSDPTAPPATGSWTWSAAPGRNYTSVTFSCGGVDHTVRPGAAGSCDVTAIGPSENDYPNLTMTINANGDQYRVTPPFDWHDYVEAQ